MNQQSGWALLLMLGALMTLSLLLLSQANQRLRLQWQQAHQHIQQLQQQRDVTAAQWLQCNAK
ncbi:hypothetical protein CWI84_09280 [Idiomarina tyrosinivorans]|uniref:Uncharacterized protein n=1 Tax=Idiomarina tyrosinivorans TaxID=1445662 RepID=A0A432ZPI9_9GAMM|nr:hypothetical protein [Idiomarina tyrosinivorans]RUO79810.1 hypothetical protein CWI84_09280 [Idiomarina tyrosinivorans]